MYRGAEIQRLYPQPEGPVLWDIDNDPMYIYMYTLPFDPRFFLQTNSDAGVFDEEGVILPFDCAMEMTTGLCVPSAKTCELEDITWCVSSPVWSMCAWSDVDNGNFAAQCARTTDFVPLLTIVPTFSEDGDVDGFSWLMEEPGREDDDENNSSVYSDGSPVLVRATYDKFD